MLHTYLGYVSAGIERAFIFVIVVIIIIINCFYDTSTCSLFVFVSARAHACDIHIYACTSFNVCKLMLMKIFMLLVVHTALCFNHI